MYRVLRLFTLVVFITALEIFYIFIVIAHTINSTFGRAFAVFFVYFSPIFPAIVHGVSHYWAIFPDALTKSSLRLFSDLACIS